MSTMGRVFGHGFGAFFLLLGGAFLVLGLNDGFASWRDGNSTCDSGSCPESGAETTFVILGASFIATGLISSLVTEYAMRKTRSIFRSVTAASADGSFSGIEGLNSFLQPFGINLDEGTNARVNVQHQTIDLRGRRTGELPREAAGLSAYLKSVGVDIEEEQLRGATVVDSRDAVDDSPAAFASPSAPRPEIRAAGFGELRRERAIIVRKRDRGETAGEQRLLELELEVQPAGRVPYRVQIATLVRESLAGLLIEGANLNVRVDPVDENRVTVDWSEN